MFISTAGVVQVDVSQQATATFTPNANIGGNSNL
jgi:hypothetical protein